VSRLSTAATASESAASLLLPAVLRGSSATILHRTASIERATSSATHPRHSPPGAVAIFLPHTLCLTLISRATLRHGVFVRAHGRPRRRR
jgi:hypothetical protein